MSSPGIPLAAPNLNQISLSISRPVNPDSSVKLFDILMKLSREAFMPKEFQLSRSLKTYLKEELALLDKRDRTIEKIALLTSLYLTEAEKLTNEYMIFQVRKLWAIVKDCVAVTEPSTKKQFRHIHPEEYIGEMGIKTFMDQLKKYTNQAKKSRGLLADQLVVWSKIFNHFSKINVIASGKLVYFVRDYLDVGSDLSMKNFEKLFPGQRYYPVIVSDQIDQLERALAAGMDHTAEQASASVLAFQHKDALTPKVIPIANPYPGINGNSGSHPIAGMGLNTGYTPGGNAPVMVPTYSMSNNRGGLAFGYQASV